LAWPGETYQDYAASIIRKSQDGGRESLVGTFGMIPKSHMRPDAKRFTTMNARSETVGTLKSYSGAWKTGNFCLVPMDAFYEPNYESGAHIRWSIGMADQAPFAVAGLYRTWEEGGTSFSFTQLTVNSDDHPLMSRFHKPNDEKRSLVIIPASEYDAWLQCEDPEVARSFLQQYPAELMSAQAAPKPPRTKEVPAAPEMF
jgi:putative SOS response-associated peptidase YedK